jgi:hypothetical protein
MPGYPWSVHVPVPVLRIEISTWMLPAAPFEPATVICRRPTVQRKTGGGGGDSGGVEGGPVGVWAG